MKKKELKLEIEFLKVDLFWARHIVAQKDRHIETLKMQIAALQKENEISRGEKSEGITKEARDMFQMVKGLSEGYVKTLPKEDPDYIPLNAYLDAGGIIKDIKRIKVGMDVSMYIELFWANSENDAIRCRFSDGRSEYFRAAEIMVYNTLPKQTETKEPEKQIPTGRFLSAREFYSTSGYDEGDILGVKINGTYYKDAVLVVLTNGQFKVYSGGEYIREAGMEEIQIHISN